MHLARPGWPEGTVWTVSPGNLKNLCCVEGTVAAAEPHSYHCLPHEQLGASGAGRFRPLLCLQVS